VKLDAIVSGTSIVGEKSSMEAGIKERNRYRDISWLMPSIDLEKVFSTLGIVVEPKHGNEIRGFCPDHHLYTGHRPSDPNWTINTDTGETFCFTEARGSNLVWTVCRVLNKEPDEAMKFLTGKSADADIAELEMAATMFKASKILKTKEDEKNPKPVRGLDAIAKDIEKKKKMSDAAYQFFIHPPGKKYPTNILRETVDRYKVFERTWGFYADRVVIPYFMKGVLVGFSAIDLLGKDNWQQKHPNEDKYRKVRYPENFQSTECLFGFDDCIQRADPLIIVEGAREVMKLSQEGFTNSVAILGSYVSPTHRRLLTELHPKRIMLMFDGDNAGVEITSRVAESLKTVFAGSRIVKCFLPRGRDPKTLDHNDLLRFVKKT